MAKILYLVHRLPYPPNKGDKVRSYHLLRHLLANHEVHLASFVDDPQDLAYLAEVQGWCASAHLEILSPRQAKFLSLRGLLSGEPLTLPFYRSRDMARWVENSHQVHGFDAVVVFSSSMAQYAALVPGVPLLVDFVDLDSAKWLDYAKAHAWPLSWLYGREGRKLLAYETSVAEQARCAFFVTDKEVELFRQYAPTTNAEVKALGNGVDAEFFSNDSARVSPYAVGDWPLVFTGAMDYWPNVDAVCWFAREVFPALKRRYPQLNFYIVGRSPTPAVGALAELPGVTVTGTVDDVRPYLQHARLVVAPLRLARGIQNKILEAMAMEKAVVASESCVGAMKVQVGRDIVAATSAEDFETAVATLLGSAQEALQMGQAARRCVLRNYSWSAHLCGLDTFLISSTEHMGVGV